MLACWCYCIGEGVGFLRLFDTRVVRGLTHGEIQATARSADERSATYALPFG
jgi:hypothetical protein